MKKILGFSLMIIGLLSAGFCGIVLIFFFAWSGDLILIFSAYGSVVIIGGILSYEATKKLSYPILWPFIFALPNLLYLATDSQIVGVGSFAVQFLLCLLPSLFVFYKYKKTQNSLNIGKQN